MESPPRVTPRKRKPAAPALRRELVDRLLIRELIENWALWRDAGDWERFATVWHDDGVMMATWFQGPAAEFIRVTREGWAKGVSILHFLGGSTIDLAGERAVAQTKMTISQRGDVQGVLCDVVCTGRFYDSSSSATAAGAWCCASRSTRKTGSTRSTPRPGSSSIRPG
jgi:SnoaL-like domain